MSGPSFTSPPAEVAEMNRIHYELEYTEGISQRMRIPDTLKVAAENQDGSLPQQQPLHTHSTLMQVPERIVVTADDGDPQFSCPRDLDLIQSIPTMELLDMKAPPRVLTLSEQPLGSLETDQISKSNPSHAVRQICTHSRSRRERSASEFISGRHSSQIIRGDVRTHLDLALEMNPDESGLVDASSLRRQIVKLNRRLQMLEEENKERSKREIVLYSATVAFWLINTWVWFRR
ncbi:mitochondrial fission factor homolog B-like isoform X3 [Phycodurus eques]|uniref:mitochondrial fission factor homolog B-like isoform X3 n=1 Tax=Phycodurus eques TaxID=693459 RepID=UPI002ACDE181|nr:mitochondrial fission factor homolog B-like isoform X3 [Phycodurus eques]